MARGLQKIEAQQKAQLAAKKGGNSTLKKDKGMKYQCIVEYTKRDANHIQATCKSEVDNIKHADIVNSNMRGHWEAKHPKLDKPTDDFASMSKAPPAAK